jgi:chromosomal replication initiator protein
VSAFGAWFSALDGEIDGRSLRVCCPDRFTRDWVSRKHGGLLLEAARAVASDVEHVVFRIDEALATRTSEGPEPEARPQRAVPAPARPGEPSFESFVSDPANVLALEAARAIARGDAGRCSPLLLTGASGAGKSHLCRAIRRELPERTAFLSSEEFTSEVTQAIRGDRMASVRSRYRRSLNVLILEDVQFLQGKRATQMEFFHTLDHLVSHGKPVVLTSDRPPAELEGLEPRLRSRIASGLVAYIGPPEADSRRAILRDKAAAGGVRLPEEAVELLAAQPTSSTGELVSQLNQVVARATLLKRPVTLELVNEALRAVAVPGRKRSIDEIMQIAARASGVSIDALRGPSRRRHIVRPRQLAMFLCRRFTDASLAEIGRAFQRDHSSVIYSLEKVEQRSLEQPQLRYELEALAQRIGP